MVVTVELVQVSCCSGCIYAIPVSLHAQMKERGKNHGCIYCPLGHQWHYTGESSQTKIDRLKFEIQEKDNALARQREQQERLKKRIHRGTCPFCRRTFLNVQRHMSCKHKVIEVNGQTLLESKN